MLLGQKPCRVFSWILNSLPFRALLFVLCSFIMCALLRHLLLGQKSCRIFQEFEHPGPRLADFPFPYDLLSIRGRRSRYSRPRVALLAAEGSATLGRESITFQASQEKNAGWRLVFMGRRKAFARIGAGAKQGKRASPSLHALRKRDGFRRGGLVRCAFAEYLFQTPRPVSCHRFLRVPQERATVFTLYVFN